jgi:AcrR family transcriptional regulator
VSKGEATRQHILGEALALASEVGLYGVSIGALAERARMSKSGLFAHFQSKEALELAILDEAVARFVADVVSPALREPRGEPRVRALLVRWLDWSRAEYMPGGCVFVASISDADDRPGPVRDRLAATQRDWLDTIATCVRGGVKEGHFRQDLDAEQFAHEVLTTAYGHHLLSRLLRDPTADARWRAATERLLADARKKTA